MGIAFDSYALIAWFRDGDEQYRKYFESPEEKFITLLVLMELYFFLYHFAGRQTSGMGLPDAYGIIALP